MSAYQAYIEVNDRKLAESTASEPLDEGGESALTEEGGEIIPLSDFIKDFGGGLLAAVQKQNPPVYDGIPNERRGEI
ncbi:MAG: hypothetical protein ACYC4K_04120, partial [Thiobacillus sp.]